MSESKDNKTRFDIHVVPATGLSFTSKRSHKCWDALLYWSVNLWDKRAYNYEYITQLNKRYKQQTFCKLAFNDQKHKGKFVINLKENPNKFWKQKNLKLHFQLIIVTTNAQQSVILHMKTMDITWPDVLVTFGSHKFVKLIQSRKVNLNKDRGTSSSLQQLLPHTFVPKSVEEKLQLQNPFQPFLLQLFSQQLLTPCRFLNGLLDLTNIHVHSYFHTETTSTSVS